jgi:DNA helicase-2/ATP-dependent DNA helicase PcrA
MTLHASKGLEFPVVCIAGLEEGLFPLQASTADPSELEEERRLLYVGITRAREQLFLSSARTRFRYGQAHPAMPSRFLEEMDPSVMMTETGRPYGQPTRYEDYGHRHSRSTSFRSDIGSTSYLQNQGRNVSAVEFVDPVDEPERVSSDPNDIVTGSRVEHQLFGSGKVISIEGSGDQARATVFFKRVGQKKLVLKFAKLRLLD